MPKVTVANTNESFTVRKGRSLLSGAKGANSPWRSYCGGMALCGTCCMLVVEGEFESPEDTERYFIEGWGYHPNYRLGCQAKVIGNATVISCADEGYEPDKAMAAYAAARAERSGK